MRPNGVANMGIEEGVLRNAWELFKGLRIMLDIKKITEVIPVNDPVKGLASARGATVS